MVLVLNSKALARAVGGTYNSNRGVRTVRVSVVVLSLFIHHRTLCGVRTYVVVLVGGACVGSRYVPTD